MYRTGVPFVNRTRKPRAAIGWRLISAQCAYNRTVISGDSDFPGNYYQLASGSPALRLFRWFYRAPPGPENLDAAMTPAESSSLLDDSNMRLSDANVNPWFFVSFCYSIFSRCLPRTVDHNQIDGAFARFEAQPELIGQCGKDCCRAAGIGRRTLRATSSGHWTRRRAPTHRCHFGLHNRRVRREIQSDVISTRQPGHVHDRTIQLIGQEVDKLRHRGVVGDHAHFSTRHHHHHRGTARGTRRKLWHTVL